MESQADQVGHSHKVAVQRKDCGAILDRNGGDEASVVVRLMPCDRDRRKRLAAFR